jgi:hypothetical protein
MNVHHAVILNRHCNDFLMVPTSECRNAACKVQVLSFSGQGCRGQPLSRAAQVATIRWDNDVSDYVDEAHVDLAPRHYVDHQCQSIQIA